MLKFDIQIRGNRGITVQKGHSLEEFLKLFLSASLRPLSPFVSSTSHWLVPPLGDSPITADMLGSDTFWAGTYYLGIMITNGT